MRGWRLHAGGFDAQEMPDHSGMDKHDRVIDTRFFGQERDLCNAWMRAAEVISGLAGDLPNAGWIESSPGLPGRQPSTSEATEHRVARRLGTATWISAAVFSLFYPILFLRNFSTSLSICGAQLTTHFIEPVFTAIPFYQPTDRSVPAEPVIFQ